MTLYVFPGGGLCATVQGEKLPATVHVLPKGEQEVYFDGQRVLLKDGNFPLPATLMQGVHSLKVDGCACEGIYIRNGMARPVGEDPRAMLPVMHRLLRLESRVDVLERAEKQKEVNWLV